MPQGKKAEQKLKELEEKIRELEQREARRKRSGVAGSVLRGLGGLIPGLDTILEGLEESDAFQERLAAINERLEAKLREAPLKEVKRGRRPGLQRCSSISVRTLAPDRRPSSIPRPGSIPRGVRKGAEKPPRREPSVDIFDEGDHLLIVAELPGAREKDIKVGMKDDRLAISASSLRHEYRKEVTLPCPAKGEIESSYKNGILQVKLAKR